MKVAEMGQVSFNFSESVSSWIRALFLFTRKCHSLIPNLLVLRISIYMSTADSVRYLPILQNRPIHPITNQGHPTRKNMKKA